MIRHRELRELLRNRLQGALPTDKVDQLSDDIEGLEGQWEEMNLQHLDGTSCAVVNCLDCWLEEQLSNGAEVRLYYKNQGRPTRSPVFESSSCPEVELAAKTVERAGRP